MRLKITISVPVEHLEKFYNTMREIDCKSLSSPEPIIKNTSVNVHTPIFKESKTEKSSKNKRKRRLPNVNLEIFVLLKGGKDLGYSDSVKALVKQSKNYSQYCELVRRANKKPYSKRFTEDNIEKHPGYTLNRDK